MKLLPTKSVDSVMAVFTKTITDLNTIAAQKYNEASRIDDKISELERKQDLAVIEAQKAERLSAKLSALVTA